MSGNFYPKLLNFLGAGLAPAQYLALSRDGTLLTWLFLCLEVSQSLTSSKRALCFFKPSAVLLLFFSLYNDPVCLKEGIDVRLVGVGVDARLTLPDSTCFLVAITGDNFLPYCVRDTLPPF